MRTVERLPGIMTAAPTTKGTVDDGTTEPLPEQRQHALEKATATRQARSELLEQVKTGDLTIQDVLQRAETDEIVKKTKLLQLLKALPGYGPTRASKLLNHIDIPDNRKIGGLGTRQRHALLEALT